MAYLLDTNVFIQAKNLNWTFDICPGFWDWILKSHSSGLIYSVEKVADEIGAGEDELSDWARNMPDGFFKKPTKETLDSMGIVTHWAMEANYTEFARSDFFNQADYYLVAEAHNLSNTVVTGETSSQSKTKIKVPNACIGVNVKCMTLFDLLRAEKVRFVLES